MKAKVVEVMYPMMDASEVYISDGSKCDLGRLQWLFGQDAKVAVQDPVRFFFFFCAFFAMQELPRDQHLSCGMFDGGSEREIYS